MEYDSIVSSSVDYDSDNVGTSSQIGRRRKKKMKNWERTKMKKARIAGQFELRFIDLIALLLLFFAF